MICGNCGSEKIHKNGKDEYDNQRYKCSECRKEVKTDSLGYEDLLLINSRLAKKNQRLTDLQRIERKGFREYARLENAVEEFSKKLLEEIKNIEFPPVSRIESDDSGKEVIVQLSDLHFNELVVIEDNKYDFRVASKRLYKFAGRIVDYIKDRNVTKINVVFTGDLLNSDRRLDELLSKATNRAKATLLASKLLSRFLGYLSNFCNVDVVSVTGNESRIREEHTFSNDLATDNFDFMVYEIMKLVLRQNERICFNFGDGYEYILNVNGSKILVAHGDKFGKMTNNDMSKIVSKWAKKGVIISFVLCGHIHEALITDHYARSASLVGSNSFSDRKLNVSSRASQNLHFVYEDGTFDSIKIDLQNVYDSSGMFDIDDDLTAYNAQSVTKLRDTTTILKVEI